MSASEYQVFARENGHSTTFGLHLEGRNSGKQPRPFAIKVTMNAGYMSSASDQLHPDEARILAGHLMTMAERCDAANEALARQK